MPRSPRPFLVLNFPDYVVVLAKTKKEATELAHPSLTEPPPTPRALMPRTAAVRYCPRYRVFWFQLSSGGPRLLLPERVPETVWSWVAHEEAPDGFDRAKHGMDRPRGRRFDTCQVEVNAIIGDLVEQS